MASAAPLVLFLFDKPAIVPIVRVMSLSFIITGTSITSLAVLRRALAFKILAWVDTAAYVVGYGLVSIVMAILGFGVWSLVVASLVQASLASVLYYYFARHPLKPVIGWASYRKLYSFGARVSVISFLEFITYSMDTMWIGHAFSPGQLGTYSRSFTLVGLPNTYLVTSFSRVLFPSFSRIQTETERLRKAYLPAIMVVFVVGTPLMWGIAAASRQVVLVMLGGRWLSAVPLVTILALAMPFTLLSSFAGILCDATAHLNVKILIRFSQLVLVLGLFGGLSRFGTVGIASAYAVGQVCVAVAFGFVLRPLLETNIRQLLRIHVPGALAGLCTAASIGGIGFAATRVGVPALPALAVQICIGVAVTCAWILRAERGAIWREVRQRLEQPPQRQESAISACDRLARCACRWPLHRSSACGSRIMLAPQRHRERGEPGSETPMKIGIAGPVSLGLLAYPNEPPSDLPGCHEAPIIAALVNALLARGHQVVVFTLSPEVTDSYVFASPELVVCVARQRRRRRSRDLYRIERTGLIELMRSHPVDVINAHWSYDYAWAALDSGAPTLVTVRDHARTIFLHAPDAFRLVRLFMNGHVLRKAKHLSANSEYLKGRLSSSQRHRTRVIHNFYSHSLDELVAKGETTAEATDRPVVASVVNGFGRRKNVSGALQGFALTRRELPEAQLRLIGDGMGEGGPAWAFAVAAGLTAGVSFLGRLPYLETVTEIAAATLLLHPALEESFCMTGLEAMVLGTPVVGGRDSGNVPFLLDHGRAGFLCDVRSPHAISEALVRAASDPERREAIRRNARTFARERFSEDTVVSAYLRYYQDILEAERR